MRRGHPTCSLLLDANEGFTVPSSARLLDTLSREDLTPVLLEQPTPRSDWAALAQVTAMAALLGVRVAADESIRHAPFFFKL